MSDEQLERLKQQLDAIDQGLTEQFSAAPDKEKWLVDNAGRLEGYSDFTDNYKNIADFIGDRNTRLANFYKDMEGKEPSEARLYSFTQKNPDISADDVKQWFAKTNTYKEDELKQREYDYQRAKRADEVKNLGFIKNLLTSDYSKQRYIDDPTTSVLGGSQFNPYSAEGQSELRDQLLGFAGAVGDALPGAGSFVGPAVRGGRDAYHKYSDEKYKPEGSVLRSLLGDMMVNAGVEYMPTLILNRAKKFTGNVGKGAKYIGDIVETNRVMKNDELLNQSHKAMDDMLNAKIYDDNTIYNSIRSLPDSEYKSELLNSLNLEKGGFRDAIIPVQRKWRTELSPDVQNAWMSVKEKGYEVPSQSSKHFLDKVYAPKLSGTQNKIAAILRAGENVGPAAVKITSTPEHPVEDNVQTRKDWYKQNYARDWSMGFKPNEKEGDPLWEAYKEWLEGK